MQVAANTRGVALLQGLVSEYGLDVISAYMGHIQVLCCCTCSMLDTPVRRSVLLMLLYSCPGSSRSTSSAAVVSFGECGESQSSWTPLRSTKMISFYVFRTEAAFVVCCCVNASPLPGGSAGIPRHMTWRGVMLTKDASRPCCFCSLSPDHQPRVCALDE